VVTEAGVVLLARSLGDAEAAARLGHLLQHRADGPLAPSAPCAVWVARALRAEARAWTVELSLRRELGVTEPSWRFPFEDAYRAAAAGQGAEVVHRWLVEHPDGAPGVPGVAAAYAARCEAAVGPPPRSP